MNFYDNRETWIDSKENEIFMEKSFVRLESLWMETQRERDWWGASSCSAWLEPRGLSGSSRAVITTVLWLLRERGTWDVGGER